MIYTCGMARLLTAGEAAAKLGVTPARLRQFRSEGRLKAVPHGPLFLYDPVEIRRFAKIDRPPHRPKSKPA